MSDYPTKLNNIGISIVGKFTKAKDHHTLQCHNCEHEWSATPISKIQSNKKYGGNGCPKCKQSKTDVGVRNKITEMLSILDEKGYDVLEPYTGSNSRDVNTKTQVRRRECGHEWPAVLHQIAYGSVVCKICNNDTKRARFKSQNDQRRAKFLLTASDWEKYRADVGIESNRIYRLHEKELNPNNKKRGLAGQPDAYQLDHIVPVRWCFDNHVPVSACADISNLQFISWEDNLSKKNKLLLDYIPASIQPYFHENVGTSHCLMAIREMLQLNDIEFETDSSVLNPYRVNVYIPERNVAIRVYDINNECEQQVISSKVQSNILKVSKVKGIRLIQIFSDEWIDNNELVMSKIIHYCGIKTDRERVHGRQCTIKQIPNDIKNTFMNMFHIQGADRSQINIGAFHPMNPDRLVAVMTFCVPRVIMGQKEHTEGKWELSRFATDTGCVIPGIASKLLTHFKRNNEWTNIYSYADARWSVGNVYDQLGFTQIKHNPPAYWYVVDGKRKHRWGYRKDAIRDKYPNVYNASKTEYQMLLEVGIDRVWDAGTILYEVDNV